MSVVKCKVVSFKVTSSLASADVVPNIGDEEDVVRRAVVREKSPPKGEPKRDGLRLNNERYEDGLSVTLESIETGRRYERFFSEEHVRRMAGVNRRLSEDELRSFGNALMARKDPIPIGVFDKDVPMDAVRVKHHPKMNR